MTAIQEIRQDIVGQAILSGLSQSQALLKAGYTDSVANTKSKRVLQSLNVDKYLQNWRETNAQKQLEALSQGNRSGEAIKKAFDTIELITDNPAVKAKLLLEFAKITSVRSQDLLDRAGISKISKSMRITSNINTKSLTDVQQRIQALKDTIDGKTPQKRGRKFVTIKGTDVTPSQSSPIGTDCTQLTHGSTDDHKAQDTPQGVDILQAQSQSTADGAQSQSGVTMQGLDRSPDEILMGGGVDVDVSHAPILSSEVEKGGQE